MGRSVVSQAKVREIKRFLGTGLQPLDTGIPSNYASNPCYCPFLLDESCDAGKDPEYKTRCRSENFGYIKCGLYAYSQDKKSNAERLSVSDPLSDTVIISSEEIVKSHNRRHGSRVDYSIKDRIAEGENHAKFGYLRECLSISPDDPRVDL